VYFTLCSSGFILGIANCYHGYNNVSLLSGNSTEFREICYTGSPLQYYSFFKLCMCFIFNIIFLSCFQVITKFIQKHKVHQQSWVDDPTLGRKVPLEISLLTTLKHPNIVSIRISVCRSAIHQCLDHLEF
jgi:hypothetical protein